MDYYLLYESGCTRCTNLALDIEAVAAGRLGIKSLNDPEVKAVLDRYVPDREWEPLLLETNGNHVRVYNGLTMRAKLVQLLGIGKAWEVARMVKEAQGPLVGSLPKWVRPVVASLSLGAVFSFFGFSSGDSDFIDCYGYQCRSKPSCPTQKEHCDNVCITGGGATICGSGSWQCGC